VPYTNPRFVWVWLWSLVGLGAGNHHHHHTTEQILHGGTWRAQGDLGQGSVSDGPLPSRESDFRTTVVRSKNPDSESQSVCLCSEKWPFCGKVQKMPKFQKTALPDLAWWDLKAQGDLGQRSVSGDPLRESGVSVLLYTCSTVKKSGFRVPKCMTRFGRDAVLRRLFNRRGVRRR